MTVLVVMRWETISWKKKDQVSGGARVEPPAKPNLSPTDSRPRSRKWPWIVAVLVVALIVVVIVVRHGKSKDDQAKGSGGRGGAGPAVVIETATVKKGDIGVYVSALGTVTPFYTVSVHTRVDGQLIKVYYKEGQLVKAGDALAEIDSAPFAASLTQAEGELARDNALLENAKLDLSRYQEAFSKNAIPKQQLDTQSSTVHQFEGTVKLDEGQVTNAQVQFNYTHITSPITGRVGLRLVDPGNIVHASDANPLVVITELQPIAVIFNVAEDYLPQIQHQLKQGKELGVDALDRAQQKKIAAGTLLTLDNQIDTTTGTLKLKAVFTNEDEVLFPNQFVNARLLVDTHRGVTLLPNPVIQHNSQGAYVYVVETATNQVSGTNESREAKAPNDAGETNRPSGPPQMVVLKTINVVTTEGDNSEVEGLEPGAVVAASNYPPPSPPRCRLQHHHLRRPISSHPIAPVP